MAPQKSFWYTVLLYLYRPNLVNKRLIGARVINCWILNGKRWENLEEIVSILQDTTMKRLDSNLERYIPISTTFLDMILSSPRDTSIMIIRKLYRKQTLKSLSRSDGAGDNNDGNNFEFDVAILQPWLNRFAILPSLNYYGNSVGDVNINIEKTNDIAFALNLIDHHGQAFSIELHYLFDDDQTTESAKKAFEDQNRNRFWLENIFKPKFEKWWREKLLEEVDVNIDDEDNNKKKRKGSSFEGSIRNISVESYCEMYHRLKERHVSPLMNIWSKVEKTDPIKFIYEDIAIAAYLITLWQEERQRKKLDKMQTFADIGCGNGLLVYLLAKEGHQGCGVDIRKRNIWDHYDQDIKLIEMRIDLFANHNIELPFDHCDWMIGNHSDELTPWIVYMAAQFSPQTRTFLLPCCCYDFDGFKFQRRPTGNDTGNKSQYQCYLDWLEELFHKFGFETFRDKLRIPSTKRICLIGYDRKPEDDDGHSDPSIDRQESRKEIRRQMVQKSLERSRHRLREKEELVRNCTRIDTDIKKEIIHRLATVLIQKSDNGAEESMTFPEAIQLLSDLSHHMKNQCGGLQTFIRNHKHIFAIQNGRIRFQSADYLKRKPEEKSPIKSKECWLEINHPKGCPAGTECSFRHIVI